MTFRPLTGIKPEVQKWRIEKLPLGSSSRHQPEDTKKEENWMLMTSTLRGLFSPFPHFSMSRGWKGLHSMSAQWGSSLQSMNYVSLPAKFSTVGGKIAF